GGSPPVAIVSLQPLRRSRSWGLRSYRDRRLSLPKGPRWGDVGVLVGQLSMDKATLQSHIGQPEKEKKAMEAWANELSSQLAWAHLRAEEAE
ncbi:hypothetical protein BHE74_00011845, partial [Ensete ventricosum]